MGWFSGKNSSPGGQGQPTPDEPFVADSRIVARVAELMNIWDDAVGNDPRMRAVARGITSAAGLDSVEQAMDNPALLHRPWKMLAAVAHHAVQSGDNILAGQVFGFIMLWNTQIAPQLTLADQFDVLLHTAPHSVENDVASVALGALQQLPDSQIIFSNVTGTLTAETLKRLAADLLRNRGVS